MRPTDHDTTSPFGSQDVVFCKEAGEYQSAEVQEEHRRRFDETAKALVVRRAAQDFDTAEHLKSKYASPLIGKIRIYDALLMLGACVDETDTELYCVSQLTHTLQVAEAMLDDGVTDKTLVLTALLHDLGKLPLLFGESPEHVNGRVSPLCPALPGVGLAEVALPWGHDEFAYQRLKGHVPDHVAWLIRYHSLDFKIAGPFMDEGDHRYHQAYLNRFRAYDLGSKSMFKLPRRMLSDYQPLLDTFFPDPILI